MLRLKIMDLFNPGDFKISIPANLSRAGKPAENFPAFQAKQYSADLGNLFMKTKDFDALAANAKAIIDNYIWPSTYMGIFYKRDSDPQFTPINIATGQSVKLSAKDLGLDDPNSAAAIIMKEGITVYVPDTSFIRISQVFYLKSGIKEKIYSGMPITYDVKPVEALGNVTAITQNISPRCRSLFIMPLKVDPRTQGFFFLGYDIIDMFGHSPEAKPFNLNDVSWLYRLGDHVGLTLNNLLSSHKK